VNSVSEDGQSGRYLSFELDGGQYAIEVERVEVVLEMVPITRVPKAAPHLKGVINYRGVVIPVADLRERFGKSGLGGEKLAERLGLSDKEGPLPEGGAAEGEPTSAAPAAPSSAPEAGSSETSEGHASIIVLQINYGSETITMGVLADAVREVVDIEPSHIERAPRLGGKKEDRLVSGIGEKDGRFIIILDVDEAFALEPDA
jgi:purine-binding chemotaxis protein CheW